MLSVRQTLPLQEVWRSRLRAISIVVYVPVFVNNSQGEVHAFDAGGLPLPRVALQSAGSSTGAGAAANTTCSRHRDTTSDPGNNSTLGTLSIRRAFKNNTGAPVTRLRFRLIDITTSPVPAGTADLRARTSSNYTATCVGSGSGCPGPGSVISINGTTLEQPPNQALGGGLNSSLSAGTVTLGTPLAPGATLRLQFLMGVEQGGSFRFFINVEALP